MNKHQSAEIKKLLSISFYPFYIYFDIYIMMIILTTHYLLYAAHEALCQFSASMSFCRLLIPVVC